MDTLPSKFTPLLDLTNSQSMAKMSDGVPLNFDGLKILYDLKAFSEFTFSTNKFSAIYFSLN